MISLNQGTKINEFEGMSDVEILINQKQFQELGLM